MGVYLRDMEKPKSCGECKFFCGLGYGFHCYLNGKHITFIGEVEDFCPLIEIDLVRCKDCKHYDTESRSFPCCTDIYGAVRYMEADGFCSKGERRAE